MSEMPEVTPPMSSEMPEATKRKFLPKLWQKIVFALLLVFAVVGVAVAAVGIYTYSVVHQLQTEATDLKTTGRGVYDQFKAQNLPAVDDGIKVISDKVSNMRKT